MLRNGSIRNSKFDIRYFQVAERVGFEPTVPVKVQQFSRLPDSTTLAPLPRGESTIVSVRSRNAQAVLRTTKPQPLWTDKKRYVFPHTCPALIAHRRARKKSCIRPLQLASSTPDVNWRR